MHFIAIAVLVAIAIPIFTSQLEKSRESTDAANLRSAYAEVMAAALTGSSDNSAITITYNTSGDASSGVKEITYAVECRQTQTGWQNTSIGEVGGVGITSIDATTLKGWTVTYTESSKAVTFTEKTS